MADKNEEAPSQPKTLEQFVVAAIRTAAFTADNFAGVINAVGPEQGERILDMIVEKSAAVAAEEFRKAALAGEAVL